MNNRKQHDENETRTKKEWRGINKFYSLTETEKKLVWENRRR